MAKKDGFFVLAFAMVFSFMLVGCGEGKPSISASHEKSQDESVTAVSEIQTGALPEARASRGDNVGAKISEDGTFRIFPIYTDGSSPDNHFVASGWMGDFGDIKFNDKHMVSPHGGTTSLQIVYSNKATQGARWSGIYWQNPPNNWGTRPGGYDLTGARKLTFWARGEKGGERIEEFKIGGITGEYADSDVAGIGPVVLTTEWQQFTIDLEGKDLSSISGGFCWATNLDVNPDGATFYLDDIRYE